MLTFFVFMWREGERIGSGMVIRAHICDIIGPIVPSHAIYFFVDATDDHVAIFIFLYKPLIEPSKT